MKPLTFAVLLLPFLLLATGQPPDEEEEEEEEEDEGDAEPPEPEGPPLQPMCDLAKLYGYKCEEHSVVTVDGYKLDFYRFLPAKEPSGRVVFLVHGLLISAEIYGLFNNSIGYQLADEGHDVWVASMRGTVHGRKHNMLNPDTDAKFWDYSWQDMGLKDIPVQLNYVTEKTKVEQIHYLGHSIGSTIFLTMASQMPEVVKKVKTATLLAPVYYFTKFQLLLKEGSSMYNMAVDTMKGFDEKQKWEAFPRSDIPKNEHQITCEDLPSMAITYCNMGMEMTKQKVGDFLPAGTSKKLLSHLQQNVVDGKVKLYNYGEEQNKKVYNQAIPPEIDLKKITTNMNIFYCDADNLASVQDVEALIKEIKYDTKLFIEDENFNHMDFLLPTSPENEKNFYLIVEKLKDIIKK